MMESMGFGPCFNWPSKMYQGLYTYQLTFRPWFPVSIEHTFIMSDTTTPGHNERFSQTLPSPYISDNSLYHVWFYMLDRVGKKHKHSLVCYDLPWKSNVILKMAMIL